MSTTTQLDQLSPDSAQWLLPVLASAAAGPSHMQSQPEPLNPEISQLILKDTTIPKKVYRLL